MYALFLFYSCLFFSIYIIDSSSDEDDEDEDDDGDEDDDDEKDKKPQKRIYYLREHKPRTKLFEVPIGNLCLFYYLILFECVFDFYLISKQRGLNQR
jgi:hypothetical protein